jgi:hypothetical protein
MMRAMLQMTTRSSTGVKAEGEGEGARGEGRGAREEEDGGWRVEDGWRTEGDV